MAIDRHASWERRLQHVLLARLLVILAVLGASLAITAGDRAELVAEVERGLYATLIAAFAASIAFAAWHHHIGASARITRFTAWQVGTDVAVVTALVHFSGGSESIFSFLYVPVAVYAALLGGRQAAYAASACAGLAYGLLFLAYRSGVGGLVDPSPQPEALRLVHWGVHVGALLLVALLSSALVAERDRADRALDERTRDLDTLRRLHQHIVESLTSGLLTVDRGGRITSFNPEAERILGLDAAVTIGRSLDEVLPGARELVLAEGYARHPERVRRRLEVRRPNGRPLHIGLSISLLRPGEGGSSGHVLIFQDLTEVVEMERALRRQERMAAIGELSARLAHEIRNPLAAISGSIEMLDAIPSDTEDRSRLKQIVLRETDRLNSLITDFLQYARPAPPVLESVSVEEVVREVGEMLEAVRSPAVEVRIEIEPGLRVSADEGQLRQVLWNLCHNALQAMPNGGCLALSGRRPSAQGPEGEGRNESSERVQIAVADTGIGIPDEALEHIFDPFFTTRKDGTGLGLATVHRIVEASEGKLAVSSTPGSGTRFEIELPGPAARKSAGRAEPEA